MIRSVLVAAVAADGLIFLVLVLNLATIRRLSRAGSGRARRPRVSIVIPARNEERSIEAAVRSHLAQDYPDFEVIVVDDQSTDRTGEILAGLARQDARLRVLEGSAPPPGWLGKPHALAVGAGAASGELLLFVDADVIYQRDALALAVEFFEDAGADLLCLLPRIEMSGFWESVLMPYLLGAYFLGPGFLTNCDRVRSIAAGGGAGNLVSRDAYDAGRRARGDPRLRRRRRPPGAARQSRGPAHPHGPSGRPRVRQDVPRIPGGVRRIHQEHRVRVRGTIRPRLRDPERPEHPVDSRSRRRPRGGSVRARRSRRRIFSSPRPRTVFSPCSTPRWR